MLHHLPRMVPLRPKILVQPRDSCHSRFCPPHPRPCALGMARQARIMGRRLSLHRFHLVLLVGCRRRAPHSHHSCSRSRRRLPLHFHRPYRCPRRLGFGQGEHRSPCLWHFGIGRRPRSRCEAGQPRRRRPSPRTARPSSLRPPSFRPPPAPHCGRAHIAGPCHAPVEQLGRECECDATTPTLKPHQ